MTISVYEQRYLNKRHLRIEGSDLSKKVSLIAKGHRIPIQANGLEFIITMDSMHPTIDVLIPRVLVSKPTTGYLLNFGDASNRFDLRFMMMLPKQIQTSKGVFLNRTELRKEVIIIDNAWVYTGLKDRDTEYATTIVDAQLRGRLVTGGINKR